MLLIVSVAKLLNQQRGELQMQNSITVSDNVEKSIILFESSEFGTIRTAEINGKIHFCGSDVAKALGYANANKAVNDHCRCITKWNTPHPQSPNKTIEMSFISEGDVYRLIVSSKLPTAQKFESWVFDEVLPSIRKQGSYTITQTKTVDPVREKEIGLARAEFLRSMALEYNGKSETYKQILDAYATKELAGEFILPLPEVKQKSYSAGEVGKMLGISATKVGRIANENNLKTENFGHWVHDKSPFSSKEVESFRYYDNAIEEIKRIVAKSEKEGK